MHGSMSSLFPKRATGPLLLPSPLPSFFRLFFLRTGTWLDFTFHFQPKEFPMIVFEANYSKKLGLPGFSSHQYSVTIRTELSGINQIEIESAKIHALLQSSV